MFKPNPKLLIIGAGHVGNALYNISRNLEFYTIIVDDRKEFENKERFENAYKIYYANVKNILKNINANDNTYVVIATRGYEKDIEALREIIDSNAAYIGMIASSKKWKSLKDELLLVKNNGELSHRKDKKR